MNGLGTILERLKERLGTCFETVGDCLNQFGIGGKRFGNDLETISGIVWERFLKV